MARDRPSGRISGRCAIISDPLSNGSWAYMLLDLDGHEIDTSAVPSLKELGIRPETLEAAEEIAGLSDVPGLERHTLELLVRAVVLSDRLAHRASLRRPK